jgi:hypothetical protein
MLVTSNHLESALFGERVSGFQNSQGVVNFMRMHYDVCTLPLLLSVLWWNYVC